LRFTPLAVDTARRATLCAFDVFDGVKRAGSCWRAGARCAVPLACAGLPVGGRGIRTVVFRMVGAECVDLGLLEKFMIHGSCQADVFRAGRAEEGRVRRVRRRNEEWES
jgi:hypothetical protein